MPENSSKQSVSSATQVFSGLGALAFANGKPKLTATFKQEFADFCVDEQLSFELTEKGEYAYLWIEKVNRSTVDVAKQLSVVTGVHGSEVGYSGMKDRCAEARQWFSIKLPAEREAELMACESDSLRIVEAHRNSRKLKIGSHRSNHFRILLRDCDGSRDEFELRLAHIEARGVPNYFGLQRFGRDLSNLNQVQVWMDAALDADSHNSAAAASIPKQRFKRSMLLSAARSYLFNQLLSRRLELGNWDGYISGDVLNLDGTNRSFVLETESEWDSTLQQRLENFDIHITGPLPGGVDPKDKYVSYGEAADIEDAVCKQSNMLLAGLRHFGLKAGRRPLRFRPSDLKWEWLQSDQTDGASDLLLDFSLCKGAYATSLVRELCVTREPCQ